MSRPIQNHCPKKYKISCSWWQHRSLLLKSRARAELHQSSPIEQKQSRPVKKWRELMILKIVERERPQPLAEMNLSKKNLSKNENKGDQTREKGPQQEKVVKNITWSAIPNVPLASFMFFFRCISMIVCLSVRRSVYPSIRGSVFRFVHRSICQSISSSVGP